MGRVRSDKTDILNSRTCYKSERLIMKRIKWLMLWCVLCLAAVCTACNGTSGKTDDKITIVCTNFALYDWTSQLLGDSEAEVILLPNNGTDMHSFQPSAEELIQIADCNLLVHVGGESDAWLMDALEANPNEDRIVVNLMEVLSRELKEEAYTEGMQTEHVHADGSVCEEEHDHSGHGEEEASAYAMDEHIWLSLRMAVKACDAIEEALCQVLPEEEVQIHTNGEAYSAELVALDQKYMEAVMNSEHSGVLIMADRFPFIYMMEDYGIEYYAAFPGCSTESEADFETVVFLAEKVKECDVDTILITESGTNTLADAVAENAGAEGKNIAILHSMQVVYNSEIEAGASYLEYMESNLEVLKQAL